MPCFEAEHACCGLDLAHLQHDEGIADIAQYSQPAKTGDNLSQEFKSLAGKLGRLLRQSSDVAAWSRQACDEAVTERV